MKLRYTPRALFELDAILDYIAERSPQGADRIRSKFEAIERLIRDQPLSGHTTSNKRLRRLVVTPYPYLVFYEAKVDEVVIAAVRHTSRNPKSMPGQGLRSKQ